MDNNNEKKDMFEPMEHPKNFNPCSKCSRYDICQSNNPFCKYNHIVLY